LKKLEKTATNKCFFINFESIRILLKLSDTQNNPERVLVEMISLDILRHLLALIYLQNVQIPPTFPPTFPPTLFLNYFFLRIKKT
jgi:hypothetical protein